MRRVDPTHRWRGGRVAEGGGLLNRYTVNSRIVGSNPIPSATITRSPRDGVSSAKLTVYRPSRVLWRGTIMRARMPYLQLWKGKWRVRKPIPKSVQAVIGRGQYLTHGLGTANR